MKSLLKALQEGRLIELPDSDKENSLRFLANVVAAIPDIQVEPNFAEIVFQREQSFSTALGNYWACPHGRSQGEGELACAIGWSPEGVNFGSPDQLPVHFFVLYYIPDNQKISYLKEISILAKAIKNIDWSQLLQQNPTLDEIRHRLLDMITYSLDQQTPDARARMIKLETKSNASEIHAMPIAFEKMIPFTLVKIDSPQQIIILSSDEELTQTLENNSEPLLTQTTNTKIGSYLIGILSKSTFAKNRTLIQAIAFKNN
jgi:PTS system nitrogen regulatory IIA component